ncbi:hypothetical protein GCM10027055_08830 [Janibacter alkaliphilus]|uniref:Putative alkaline shock family protein YloU n=1 Tax=Janibacter alkaliphilus TaxID=1069963 RepID=A0A852WZL2_9MICO|nr:putative alkaline shock family protein YloU [Janibacter alkaliphilus]
MADGDGGPDQPATDDLSQDTPDNELRHRGTLDVRVAAIRRIAERASLDVAGTVRRSSTLGRLRGTAAPHADVRVSDRTARIELRVACAWPAPVSSIATEVRDTVLRETSRLSGVPVTTVDVTAVAVSPDDQTSRRTVA